jgi:1-acyl-sn-glycerol-3-phosphate acyltransferase
LWGYLVKKWGVIPIHRRDLTKAIASLDQAAVVLQSGTSIVVLPEGHRTLTGKIGEFKKGPFHLALAARADILPFALSGLFEYCSKHGWHLMPRTVHVLFGEPIPYDTFKDDSVEEIQRKMRERIINLKQTADNLFTKI